MIIVEIMGGLGNQMFQYAYSRAIQEEYKENLYISTDMYNQNKIRTYSLCNLNINTNIHNINFDILDKYKLKKFRKMYRLYQKVKRTLKKSDVLGENLFNFCTKRGMLFNYDRYYYDTLKTDKDIKYIFGYFQSEKYFYSYKDIIKEELKVNIPPTEKEITLINEINNCNSIGVSMRLGDDYINSKGLNVCTDEFYRKGMNYISDKYEDAIFYIFSDDINKAKKIIGEDKNIRYIEGFNDFQSMRLLYSCKHFIISNSSFAWWGSYLSDNESKVIVAPNRWYNDADRTPDIYTKDMYLIEV